ncbi:MAG: hypothetical protein QOJ13_1845 [Gaiellales bacterium]|nr:hypothetical protein [Gaiellales bacterium]
MNRRLLSMLVVVVAAPLASPPSDAQAGPAPTRFITYMFGRAQLGGYVAGSGCTTPLSGNVSLWTVADALAAQGHTATVPVTLNMTGTNRPVCAGTIAYATWNDLARLRDQYSWSFSSRGRSGHVLTGMTGSQQQAEICGSIGDFRARGFGEVAGMFSYPGNNLTAAMQTTFVNSCYSFGRKYAGGVNRLPIPAPYWAATNSVNGGRCNNPSLDCYTMAVKNNRRYTSPDALVGYENSNGWTMIQWYRLVTGRSGTVTSKAASWDCTSADRRNHWTNEPEMSCWDDALYVINALAPGAVDTNPTEMAARQGRAMP